MLASSIDLLLQLCIIHYAGTSPVESVILYDTLYGSYSALLKDNTPGVLNRYKHYSTVAALAWIVCQVFHIQYSKFPWAILCCFPLVWINPLVPKMQFRGVIRYLLTGATTFAINKIIQSTMGFNPGFSRYEVASIVKNQLTDYRDILLATAKYLMGRYILSIAGWQSREPAEYYSSAIRRRDLDIILTPDAVAALYNLSKTGDPKMLYRTLGYLAAISTLVGIYQYRIAGILYAVHYYKSNVRSLRLTTKVEAAILALPIIYPPLVLMVPALLFFIEHDGPAWMRRELINSYYIFGWRLFGPVHWKLLVFLLTARESSIYGVVLAPRILPYAVCFLSNWDTGHILMVFALFYIAENLAQNYDKEKKKPVANHVVIEDYSS